MVQWKGILEKIDDYRWGVPVEYKQGMKVPGVIYADESMLEHILRDQAVDQVANVAFLPGIEKCSLAMPDIHWGYGFPIGGVAAMRVEDGVISPGGVGFDINCGVRIMRTNLTKKEVLPRITELVEELYRAVPSGLGSEGKIRLRGKDIDRVLVGGSRWAVENGYGTDSDLQVTEENGEMKDADPETVSIRAKERGTPQLGTLGSGNHFLEIAAVDAIYDVSAARTMGISEKGQIVLLVHTGSRGLGHQVADDYIKVMVKAMEKYGFFLPDRQLACSPVSSPEGKRYLSAMRCAANYAWANRQCISHWVREAFCHALDITVSNAGLELIYDVTHNIAKIETHTINGKQKKLCVHRKGATRAFPSGHKDIPLKYRQIGQPVLIPGDMGRASYLLTGTDKAMEETFGSTCHGAGRLRSRASARKMQNGRTVLDSLASQGITIRTGSLRGLTEESPEAYKDVDEVVAVACNAGICNKVVRTVPLGVVKG